MWKKYVTADAHTCQHFMSAVLLGHYQLICTTETMSTAADADFVQTVGSHEDGLTKVVPEHRCDDVSMPPVLNLQWLRYTR